MKILSIATGASPTTSHSVTQSNLYNSTPFGYDAIIVNTANTSAMYGTNSPNSVDTRWKNAIEKWANGKRKIIVLMENMRLPSLNWLPIDQIAKTTLSKLESAGTGNYLGDVSSVDSLLRHFLLENKDDFRISTYLRYDDVDETISVNSGVDSTLITSFTYKKDKVEIIFIPHLPPQKLDRLFTGFDQPANAWGIEEAENIKKELAAIDTEIDALYSKRDGLNQQLIDINQKINSAINSDLYLIRAIGHFDATKSTDNPSPESYYGAVEAIEKAFESEHQMRETLGLTKGYVDKVMRRANEFRHEAKSGQPPAQLTTDEINDFNERVNAVISKYIQHILN